MTCAAKFLIAGKVQGVWFRAHARERALALGLCGHAINLDDGRVEVLAIGDEQAVDALERWLWQGSPLSAVSSVTRCAVDGEVSAGGFITG